MFYTACCMTHVLYGMLHASCSTWHPARRMLCTACCRACSGCNDRLRRHAAWLMFHMACCMPRVLFGMLHGSCSSWQAAVLTVDAMIDEGMPHCSCSIWPAALLRFYTACCMLPLGAMIDDTSDNVIVMLGMGALFRVGEMIGGGIPYTSCPIRHGEYSSSDTDRQGCQEQG